MVYAAGLDAGNRSMRAGGRKVWAVNDFNAASAEVERLMPFADCNYTVRAMRYELATREDRP